jgi:hypothetical protein
MTINQENRIKRVLTDLEDHARDYGYKGKQSSVPIGHYFKRILKIIAESQGLPDSIQEALNSGDGTYKP